MSLSFSNRAWFESFGNDPVNAKCGPHEQRKSDLIDLGLWSSDQRENIVQITEIAALTGKDED